MDYRFKHTTKERKNSVVYGSVGKGGLFNPADFRSQTVYEEDEQSPLLNPDYDQLEAACRRNSSSTELLRQERELLKDNNLLDTTVNDNSSDYINNTWEEAVSKGLVKTNLRFEMKSLSTSSFPLIITFLLQNSFSLASIFSVGHIGKSELAGITLGSMTANITGFAAIQGLTTCLDTLCSQAYGAGKYKLVGLHFVRCSVFAISCFFPIALIWIFASDPLLKLIIPEPELVEIASRYLSVVSFGIPGFILFECGKRYLQCQGIFHASTYVLLICAPLNALMNYLFVWKFKFGYIGAPLAIAINYWAMPLGLFIFSLNTKTCHKCWPNGLPVIDIFKNWSKMMYLALPGVIMVEAEFLGFEVITIMASYLGTTELASQSVVSSVAALFYQVPFSISIASATRIANYIGASLVKNAQKCCRASINLGLIVGVLNSIILFKFRYTITNFFTNDQDVISQVVQILPLISLMEIFDCLNACLAGCLRGEGLQKFGGYINLFSFYIIGIPLSYLLTFHYSWGLFGLWAGIVCGLISMFSLQFYTVFIGSDWEKIVQDAKHRNNE